MMSAAGLQFSQEEISRSASATVDAEATRISDMQTTFILLDPEVDPRVWYALRSNTYRVGSIPRSISQNNFKSKLQFVHRGK